LLSRVGCSRLLTRGRRSRLTILSAAISTATESTATAATTAPTTAACALFEGELFFVSSSRCDRSLAAFAFLKRVVHANAIGHVGSRNSGAAGLQSEVGFRLEQRRDSFGMVLLDGPHQSGRTANRLFRVHVGACSRQRSDRVGISVARRQHENRFTVW